MERRTRTFLEALVDDRVTRVAAYIFAIALAITLAVGITQNLFIWFEKKPPQPVASIDAWKLGMVTGTTGTATAFLVTLFVAQRNYRRSRQHIPNLTMNLTVERLPVSQSYDGLMLSLEAQNTGTGLCNIETVHWIVLTLAPYDDETVEDMIKEQEGDKRAKEPAFPWQRLAGRETSLYMTIEPGEKEQITQDFVIESEPTAIVAYAWVENASEPNATGGWLRRTIHIQQEGERNA